MMKDRQKYDRRTVDRNIEKGRIKEADFLAHLKDLPDDAASAQYVQVDLYDAEMGESDKDDSHSSEEGNHSSTDSDEDT